MGEANSKNIEFEIRDIKLSDLEDLNEFKCGNPSMDDYLIKEAYLNHVLGEGRTKVVVLKSTSEIVGYYTLKCDSIKIKDEEMYLEERFIPCIEISRIAVHRVWQNGTKGIYLGTNLMGYIIQFIIKNIAPSIGCRFITLHSVLNKINWYQKEFGFDIWDESLDLNNYKEDTVYMYLDIKDKEGHEEYLEYMRK